MLIFFFFLKNPTQTNSLGDDSCKADVAYRHTCFPSYYSAQSLSDFSNFGLCFDKSAQYMPELWGLNFYTLLAVNLDFSCKLNVM